MQIAGFRRCLDDTKTTVAPPSCAPFSDRNATAEVKACLRCIQSAETDPAYGPMVTHGGTVSLNLGGCMAIALNDLDGRGCATSKPAARLLRPESDAAA